MFILVPLVLQPRGIAPTILKLDSLSPGASFIPIIVHHGNKLDKEREIVRKKLSFMHTKRYNTFLKIWVQSRVGAIPCLPFILSFLNWC